MNEKVEYEQFFQESERMLISEFYQNVSTLLNMLNIMPKKSVFIMNLNKNSSHFRREIFYYIQGS